MKLLLISADFKRNITLSGMKSIMEEGIRHFLEKPQNVLRKNRASAYFTTPEEGPQ